MLSGIAVFDFDWSLIEEDSDYWTIYQLSPTVWDDVLERRKSMQWTDLMDYAICQLQDRGYTPEDMANVLRTIPFSKEMRNVLLDLKSRKIPVILMSDANHFYINTILKAYQVHDCVTEIITNPTYVDERGRMRIRRLIQSSDPQHNCINPCAENICKGREMDMIMSKYGPIHRIAYTGDGRNDFCPGTRLRTTDTFFIRREKGLDAYLKRIPTEKNKLQSQLVYWTNPVTVWESMPQLFTLFPSNE
ncbi:phosphatase phospho-type [Pilobolus umbonatus]|nr:phosphatase phospho-type [Pilobolus umbonatus]